MATMTDEEREQIRRTVASWGPQPDELAQLRADITRTASVVQAYLLAWQSVSTGDALERDEILAEIAELRRMRARERKTAGNMERIMADVRKTLDNVRADREERERALTSSAKPEPQPAQAAYHPDPEINTEVTRDAIAAEASDLAAGFPPRWWTCPQCGASHNRGHHQAVGTHRCLKCGYVGTGGVMDESAPDPQPARDVGELVKMIDMLAGVMEKNPYERHRAVDYARDRVAKWRSGHAAGAAARAKGGE